MREPRSVRYTIGWRDVPWSRLGLAGVVLFGLCAMLLVVWGVVIIGTGPSSASTGVLVLACGLLVAASIAVRQYRGLHVWRRAVGLDVTLTLDDEALTIRNSLGQTSVQPWATLRKATVQWRHLVIVGWAGRVAIIPKRGLGGPADVAAFLDEVRECIAGAQDSTSLG